MVDKEKLLEEAKLRFPIGTKFISLRGCPDIINGIPRVGSEIDTIAVDCIHDSGRRIYEKGIWAKVVSDKVNNFEIW